MTWIELSDPPGGGSFWDPFWDTPCEEPWLPGVHLALGGSIWGSQMTLFGVPGTPYGPVWGVLGGSFGGLSWGGVLWGSVWEGPLGRVLGGVSLGGVLGLCLNMTWGSLGGCPGGVPGTPDRVPQDLWTVSEGRLKGVCS